MRSAGLGSAGRRERGSSTRKVLESSFPALFLSVVGVCSFNQAKFHTRMEVELNVSGLVLRVF